MARVDLHLHTTFSDGRLTPTELVRLCAERGLETIAVSDHDSTEGLDEAFEAASELPGLSIIPAIELSTDVPGSEIHVLGYFVDRYEPDFQKTLTSFRDSRERRGEKMVEQLAELGVEVSWERVKELSGGGSIGRPHIAQALVEAGYVRYPKDAFDKYIGRSGPAYAERIKLTPAEAVAILKANGAVPVMAHPTYSASKSDRDEVDQLRDILTGLKDAGLAGMEVHYGDYSPQQVEYLARLAKELDLIPCGGSDYHASGNPGEPEPGTVGPPLETVEALRALSGRAVS